MRAAATACLLAVLLLAGCASPPPPAPAATQPSDGWSTFTDPRYPDLEVSAKAAVHDGRLHILAAAHRGDWAVYGLAGGSCSRGSWWHRLLDAAGNETGYPAYAVTFLRCVPVMVAEPMPLWASDEQAWDGTLPQDGAEGSALAPGSYTWALSFTFFDGEAGAMAEGRSGTWATVDASWPVTVAPDGTMSVGPVEWKAPEPPQ